MLLRHDRGARVQRPYVANKSALVVGLPLSCGSCWKSDGDRKALLFMGLCQGCSPFNPYNVAKLLPFCLLFEGLGKQICQGMFRSFENCSAAHFLPTVPGLPFLPSCIVDGLDSRCPWSPDSFLHFFRCHIRGSLYLGRIKNNMYSMQWEC